MGQRYTIPFKDFRNNSYEVRIYIDGYSGTVSELRGAPSAFVVTGDDEGFIYQPVRTSTATINILDKNLLLDLFSVNSQYASVKLYKNGVLTWTGYITPEQFTQPYLPTIDNISVDCASAIATLENIKYEQQTESGFITAMELLRYLISSAHGGYESVYIPYVYASSSAAYSSGENVLDKLRFAEENFTSDELMLDEVLTYLMQFFSWTLYDYEGSLYIIDADYTGQYRKYNEALTSYAMVSVNDATLQDIGFAGSDNTIDVLPGYNKVTVKAVNNVFEDLVVNEDYDSLEWAGGSSYSDKDKYDIKRFLKPKEWKMYYYDQNRHETILSTNINDNIFGAVLMKEALFTGGGDPPGDYNWADSIQMRSATVDGVMVFDEYQKETLPAFTMRGPNAVWKDGAIGISGSMRFPSDSRMNYIYDGDMNISANIPYACSLKIGDKYWNGSGWQSSFVRFEIVFETDNIKNWANVKSTKTPDMPYSGLSGHIITLPSDVPIIGELEFTMYCRRQRVAQEVGFVAYGAILKDFRFDYKKKDGIIDEGEDGDRLYENVVNDKFMSELDEVEFGISSYNADGASYSKALLGNDFLTDNLYSAIEGKLVRPEEAFIRRVINRYKATQIKLTQVIKNDGSIHPFTRLYDKSAVNKRFMLLSGVWDYERNNIQLSMVENGN